MAAKKRQVFVSIPVAIRVDGGGFIERQVVVDIKNTVIIIVGVRAEARSNASGTAIIWCAIGITIRKNPKY